MDLFHCMFDSFDSVRRSPGGGESIGDSWCPQPRRTPCLCYSKNYGEKVKFDSHALVAMTSLHHQKTSGQSYMIIYII